MVDILSSGACGLCCKGVDLGEIPVWPLALGGFLNRLSLKIRTGTPQSAIKRQGLESEGPLAHSGCFNQNITFFHLIFTNFVVFSQLTSNLGSLSKDPPPNRASMGDCVAPAAGLTPLLGGQGSPALKGGQRARGMDFREVAMCAGGLQVAITTVTVHMLDASLLVQKGRFLIPKAG